MSNYAGWRDKCTVLVLCTTLCSGIPRKHWLLLGLSPERHTPHPIPQGAELLVPPHLEVAHLPYQRGGPFPGIFLFSSPARMVRPVQQLPAGGAELVGSLEQAHTAIRWVPGLVDGSIRPCSVSCLQGRGWGNNWVSRNKDCRV